MEQELRIGQYKSLLDLSRSESLINGNFASFIQQAILTISAELHVSRVSFWAYDKKGELIKNQLLYDREKDKFTAHEILLRKDYPNYFNAFHNQLSIVANDARTDLRTKEFTEKYLDVYQIVSMMDIQVSVHGELFGIICLEQTHEFRDWDKSEELFVSTVASYIAQAHITELKNQEVCRRQESEVNYEVLFFDSPVPMWVYHPETYRFLAVNHAAIRNYGYSEKEFREMTIFDIRPTCEHEKLTEFLNEPVEKRWKNSDWKHKLKSGDIIEVEISSNWTTYRGEKARIVMTSNITNENKLKYEKELSLKKLEDFAFYASHNLRGPVARLLGLNVVLEEERKRNNLSENTLDLMHLTAREIDDMVKGLNKKLER